MSLPSPKKDNKLKSPILQNKVSKTSPLSTSRGANLASNKATSFSRQSPNPIKAASQKDSQKVKVQNTSIKDLEEKLGELGTILANIKTEPEKKQSPTHKQKEVLRPAIKKNSSAAEDKKNDPLVNSSNPYRKDVVRKTCPDVVKAFETSKMLLNPSDLINPRMTADKNDKAKLMKIKSGDPYQLIDLAAGSRKSFKINNLQLKKPDCKLESKTENKKVLKSNEHSGKNLTSLQKQQAKMRATMSNNLLPKYHDKKEAIKTLLDDSKSENKTMEESAQSLPQIECQMKKSMVKDKRMPIEVTTTASFIPGSALKDELLQITSRNRINSPLLDERRKCEDGLTKISEFEMIKELGSGKFSEVFLAVHKSSGLLFAIKQISKEKVRKFNMVRQVTDEIKLHSTLNHPNIIKFYGLLEDPANLYLILEFIEGGSLFDHLTANEKISVKMTSVYLRDVISAIQYLHDKSIAHRDLKPENILIGMGCVAKVCDLGWSALILTSRKTYCGTFDYVPPEILEKKDYDLSVDIWCLGILTYELLVGKVPYGGDKHTVVMSKINNAQIPFPEESGEFPPSAKSYIQWLLQHNPQERPKSKQLLDHDFFQQTKQEPIKP